MSDQFLRRYVERAIENRLSLTELTNTAANCEPSEQAYLRREIQLDDAIHHWRMRQVQEKRYQRSRAVVAVSSLLAAGLAGVALISLKWDAESFPQDLSPAVAISQPVVEPELPQETTVTPIKPLVAPIPEGSEQFAAATVTAERLAYALQPVGEHVGSVVQMLLDAVPGSEVFAL